ncbi:hypothetical protein HHI36_019563, partial [Cryptolaemus montrouzieri]
SLKMSNPNSNPLVQRILHEQNRKIEEVKRNCVEEYGTNILSDTLLPVYDSLSD